MNNHNFYMAQPGMSTIKQDFQTVEWGREPNASWVIGRSSNPVFFTADGHNVRLEDSARGSSVLIMDKNFELDIDITNIHTWAIDEAILHHKCKIWTPNQNNKAYSIKDWCNQSVLKLLPLQIARDRRSDQKLISHSPNCFYYRRHTSFNIGTFLLEETIWQDGSDSGNIVAALKIAIVLGYRTIFLATTIDTTSRAFRHLEQISKILPDTIKIRNCGNISIFTTVDISEAYASCILN